MSIHTGLKVLVVEDEGSIALLIEDMLLELGCEVIASVARLAKACASARISDLDFAVVDLNLNGESALPVARVLQERGIPFVFSTGYGAEGLPPEFDGFPILGKPFSIADLKATISAVLSRQTAQSTSELG